jgi:hypothetical protein
MPKINYTAVLVAAIMYFMLGAVWYTIWGAKYIQLMNWTPEKLAQIQQQSVALPYLVTFLTDILLAYALAHFIHYTKAMTALEGLLTAFWLWLGFVVVTNLNTVVFEFRPLGLYLINTGYHLVGLALMGALLAVWKK